MTAVMLGLAAVALPTMVVPRDTRWQLLKKCHQHAVDVNLCLRICLPCLYFQWWSSDARCGLLAARAEFARNQTVTWTLWRFRAMAQNSSHELHVRLHICDGVQSPCRSFGEKLE